jgi:lipopolysaccharide biosynthesis protein
VRALAFHLPQFHPIPENDRWWGREFTEWTNVVKARPLFPNHYQPRLPADLGFYDLRLPEARDAQAELARTYGLSGFCYYHYWVNGRRLLHRPFDEVLESGAPDFPFCVCWANENWTRRWDGGDQTGLMRQEYSLEDDERHIEHLLPAFHDSRYIKIDGRPLFLIYRTEFLPTPARTAAVWRERARAAGFPDLYLVRVESFSRNIDPRTIGFNAAIEFAPDWKILPLPIRRRERWDMLARIEYRLRKVGLISTVYAEHKLYWYDTLVKYMLAKPVADYKRFRCVTPGFDNSPRRVKDSIVFLESTPHSFEAWLRTIVRETLLHHVGGERIVFINAWNEWAEGNYLEPDQRRGLAYLEAAARALNMLPTCVSGDPHSRTELT